MNELYDKLYGCLIGGAVGDALTRADTGRWGGHTALQCHVIKRFLYKRSRLTAADVAAVIEALKGEGINGGDRLSAVVPIGLMNAGGPEQAYWDGLYITGDEMGGAYACAVASAMEKNAVAGTVLGDVYKYSGEAVLRALEPVLALTERTKDATALVTALKAVQAEERGIPAAFGIAKLCGEDVSGAIELTLSLGGSAAALTGGLIGAMYGFRGLSTDWVMSVDKANEDFLLELFGTEKIKRMWDVADMFYYAMRVMCDGEQKRWNALRARLGDINGDRISGSYRYHSLNPQHKHEGHIVPSGTVPL